MPPPLPFIDDTASHPSSVSHKRELPSPRGRLPQKNRRPASEKKFLFFLFSSLFTLLLFLKNSPHGGEFFFSCLSAAFGLFWFLGRRFRLSALWGPPSPRSDSGRPGQKSARFPEPDSVRCPARPSGPAWDGPASGPPASGLPSAGFFRLVLGLLLLRLGHLVRGLHTGAALPGDCSGGAYCDSPRPSAPRTGSATDSCSSACSSAMVSVE